jgi:hypothetical protein
VPSFSRFLRAYRFPDGMALAPLRKLKGCRAGDRANSLTATLDSKYYSCRYYVYSSLWVEYCQRQRANPEAFMLRYLLSPMIIWSRTSMPMICLSSTSLFVRPISCSEVDVSPNPNNHSMTIFFGQLYFCPVPSVLLIKDWLLEHLVKTYMVKILASLF